MSAFKLALTALSVAVSASRHPIVRTAIRQAPRLMNERTKLAAAETAKGAAYRAGMIAGRLMAKSPPRD